MLHGTAAVLFREHQIVRAQAEKKSRTKQSSGNHSQPSKEAGGARNDGSVPDTVAHPAPKEHTPHLDEATPQPRAPPPRHEEKSGGNVLNAQLVGQSDRAAPQEPTDHFTRTKREPAFMKVDDALVHSEQLTPVETTRGDGEQLPGGGGVGPPSLGTIATATSPTSGATSLLDQFETSMHLSSSKPHQDTRQLRRGKAPSIWSFRSPRHNSSPPKDSATSPRAAKPVRAALFEKVMHRARAVSNYQVPPDQPEQVHTHATPQETASTKHKAIPAARDEDATMHAPHDSSNNAAAVQKKAPDEEAHAPIQPSQWRRRRTRNWSSSSQLSSDIKARLVVDDHNSNTASSAHSSPEAFTNSSPLLPKPSDSLVAEESTSFTPPSRISSQDLKATSSSSLRAANTADLQQSYHERKQRRLAQRLAALPVSVPDDDESEERGPQRSPSPPPPGVLTNRTTSQPLSAQVR